MGWNTLLPNQCISFNNLQDGCNLGLFLYTQPIPVSTQQITKQDFEDYILVPASVTNYPPFANKPQNQLVVKDNVALYGDATLVPNYGISFTGVYLLPPTGVAIMFSIYLIIFSPPIILDSSSFTLSNIVGSSKS